MREYRGASSSRESANGNPSAASACARTSPATAARRPAPPTAGPRDRASSSYALFFLRSDVITRAVDDKIPGEIVLADAAFGGSSDFRNTVRMFGLDLGVAVSASTKVWPLDKLGRRRGDPLGVQYLGGKRGRQAFRRLTWREGPGGRLSSCFAFCPVKVAHDDGTDAGDREPMWLVIEWPEGEAKPTKFVLTTLPRRMTKKQIVRIIKERWRTERAYDAGAPPPARSARSRSSSSGASTSSGSGARSSPPSPPSRGRGPTCASSTSPPPTSTSFAKRLVADRPRPPPRSSPVVNAFITRDERPPLRSEHHDRLRRDPSHARRPLLRISGFHFAAPRTFARWRLLRPKQPSAPTSSVATDDAFQRRARLLQALWREACDLPIGAKASGEPLGSRLHLSFAKETLANFMTDAAKRAVRAELHAAKAGTSGGKLMEADRHRREPPLESAALLQPLRRAPADLSLATRVFHALYPERVAEVTAIHFEHSPGQGDERYTGDRSAFDVFVEHTTQASARGFIGIEVKYHEGLNDAPSSHKPR